MTRMTEKEISKVEGVIRVSVVCVPSSILTTRRS